MHRHGHKCDSSHYFNLFYYFISTFMPFWHLILLGAIVYKLTIYAYLCHLSLYCLQPMYYLYLYHSPLGPITLCGNDRALTGLWFNGQQHFGSTIPPNTHLVIPPYCKMLVGGSIVTSWGRGLCTCLLLPRRVLYSGSRYGNF